MKSIDTIIHAHWVLPIVPRKKIFEHHSIAIHQGNIIDILPTEKTAEKYTAKNSFDRTRHVVMPGLINTHTHTPMNLFRGIADDLPLMEWLQKHIWPAENKYIHPESIYYGSLLAQAEMIRGGTTCFNDHYFFPNDIARAAIKSGIRASIGHVIMNVPTGWAKDAEDYINKARAAHAERVTHPLITWMIAPQGPYTNSDHSLRMAKAMADQHGLRVHMHLHETQAEIEIDLKQHGMRPMQRLHRLGLLDENFLAVHMVHLTDEEIALCKKTGLHISHNPESNLKLASGFAPVVKLMKAGINVSLATDGAASNNDLDMFGEMRTASFLAKGVNQDPTALDVHTTLEMATINGAKALGLEKEIGSIEIGKSADIISVELENYLTQPIYHPASHLVYAVNRLQVNDVWVNGNILLCDQKHMTMDVNEIVARVKKFLL